MILRARVVLPISRPPIRNGAVLIRGPRIAAVASWRELRAASRTRVFDLGEVVLLPGLINAHCHLDYTHMAGQLPPPRLFTDWLKVIVATKSGWTLADYQQSWSAGAAMLLQTGTTTVADIEAVPDLLPGMWQTTPLRVLSYLELIGITRRRLPQELLQQALRKIRSLPRSRCRAGLAPHAPYSTLPELLRLSSRAACRHRLPLSIHAAESRLEFDMFTHGRGPMHEWLQASGRDMADCGLSSPIRHLERCGLLIPGLVVAHANYLARGDATLLARHKASVAHCPRSHAYFAHDRLPIRQLLRAGVNVCLGTDSLASVYRKRKEQVDLSLLEEIRVLAAQESWLSPAKILRMATLNGARALGLQCRVGELAPRAWADLIAIPGAEKTCYDDILRHQGNVSVGMIGGHWTVRPDI